MEQFDIAICGYGPVGSTFAGLMGKLGHKVLVIEKNNGPSPTARAINTDGEQIRTFDRLGIAEKVVENSTEIHCVHFGDANLNPIQTIEQPVGVSAMGWPNQVLFYQPELEGFIRASVESENNIVIKEGTELLNFYDSEEGVELNCKNVKESFVSSYNPRIHRLDKNINNINFINTLSPKENEIIENAIKNDNNNLSNKMKQITNPDDMKQIYLEYLSNNQSYSSIMSSINQMNQGATDYLYQESSNLVDMINRKNNVFDYNYHYGLSFWIYFDSEILKDSGDEREGLILNYAYTPIIYYDYKIQELIIEINKCDKKITGQKSDIVCEERKMIYKTSDILFQRWNHFVINYNYGTLDIFINNNLVATQKNVSPYIQSNNNSIQFGSNQNTLKNCGICNIRYYNIPLNLTQIRNIYGNKDNPCK